VNDLLALRTAIYEHFATTGRAPSRSWLAGEVGDITAADTALHRLHELHMVVLGDDGEIDMALPFSSTPTDHLVTGDGCSWWANCSWDALAVVAALDVDARIESTWVDTGETVHLSVTDGRLEAPDGLIHFAVPARHWWDDIRET